MIEWRDSHLSTHTPTEEYNRVPDEKLKQLADCMDYLFDHYVKGAINESSQSYNGHEKGRSSHTLTLNYSDITFNAYHEGVVTDTHISLEHVKNKLGTVREAYDIIVERDITLERRSQQSTDAIFSSDTSKSSSAFIEYYSIEQLVGGEYRGYVSQLDEVSAAEDIQYDAMSLYDLTHLVAELDKIADLYASYQRERAIIEQ